MKLADLSAVFSRMGHRLRALLAPKDATTFRGDARPRPLSFLLFLAKHGAVSMKKPLCVAFLLVLACDNTGEPPPVGRLVFPIALGISPDNQFLFVANSNFDLRFNAGSLHSYDLDTLNDGLDQVSTSCDPSDTDSCGIIPVEDERDDLLDNIEPVEGLLVDQVRIGSYVDGMAVASNDGVDSRLYMPVRSDANLTFVDVTGDGCFQCNAGEPVECASRTNLGRPCDDAFRRGDDEAATLRDIQLPADPVAVTVGPLSDVVRGDAIDPADVNGNYIIFAHRDGRASLFFDQIEGGGMAPTLVHTLSGLPTELVDITIEPSTQLAWLPSAINPVMGRVGIAFDGMTNEPERSYLFNAGDMTLTGVDTGTVTRGDTRVVRFDPRPDVERAYVLSRRPRALLVVDTADSVSSVNVIDAIEVGFGPSRLDIVQFNDTSDPVLGDIDRTLAFISCYDSRDVYIVDVDLGRLVGVVRGLGGPFELAVDTERKRVYVLDFRSSVIRVIDLLPMFVCLSDDEGMMRTEECSPRQIGVVGRPDAVTELR